MPKIDRESRNAAIQAVIDGLPLPAAVEKYGVPYSTLARLTTGKRPPKPVILKPPKPVKPPRQPKPPKPPRQPKLVIKQPKPPPPKHDPDDQKQEPVPPKAKRGRPRTVSQEPTPEENRFIEIFGSGKKPDKPSDIPRVEDLIASAHPTIDQTIRLFHDGLHELIKSGIPGNYAGSISTALKNLKEMGETEGMASEESMIKKILILVGESFSEEDEGDIEPIMEEDIVPLRSENNEATLHDYV